MTACTNNGGKARRVVTAALVGALSVGAVPAIALATGDVSLQAVEPGDWADATIASATNGGGNTSLTDEEIKDQRFEFVSGSGEYLVPTSLGNVIGEDGKPGTVNVDEDMLAYTMKQSAKNNSAQSVNVASTTVKGLKAGWNYWYIDGEGKRVDFKLGADYALNADQAAAYFGGTLKATNFTQDWTVVPVNGGYTVTVADESQSKSFDFSVVKADEEFVVKTAAGSQSFVFNNTFMFNSDQTTDIVVYESDGETPITESVTWTDKDGQALDPSKATTAGTYTGTFTRDAKEYTVTATVAPLDLSTASITVGSNDWFKGGEPTDYTSFLKALKVNGQDAGSTYLYLLLSASEASPAQWSDKGEHTVKVGANEKALKSYGYEGSIVNDMTVSYGVLDKDVSSDLTLKYGDMTVSGVLYVNLFKGEKFDASKLSVVYGGETYKGDQLDVTVGGDATKETKGTPITVTVRLKAQKGADNKFFGGTKTLDLHVAGADLDADQRLYFYLDGKLVGDDATVTYDGEDWLERLEVVVKDADGNDIDPSSYEVKATKGGKEVDSATDAGSYTVTVTGKTFDFDDGTNTLSLTVEPLSVDKVEVVPDLEASDASYLTWTGEELTPDFKFYDKVDGEYVEVEVPAEAYEVSYNLMKLVQTNVGSPAVYEYVVDKKDVELKDEGVYKAVFDTAVDVHNYDLDGVESDYVEVTKKGVFLDVPANEWYSQRVYDAVKLGYMNGDGGGKTFGPMRELTRAEAACVLFNMAGGNDMYSDATVPGYVPEGKVYETGFSDVEGNEFFAKAVAWCKATGVINGYADGTFGVSRKVTNEEFACMLANYAKAKGEDVTVEDADATLAEYPDASVVSDWAKDAVAWCVSEGIMGGGANISPAGSILRMRAATMAVNAQPEALSDLVIPVYPIQ